MEEKSALNVIEYKWNNPIITGDKKAPKPGLLSFKNSDVAIEILNSHINNKDKIAIHCDVDVDGIGSGYIIGKFISSISGILPYYLINKDKEHGIKQKYVDYFSNKKLDLLIIVDSSSNELEVIKKFNCDVIVIDHHSVSHEELSGYTDDGIHKFVIVNNTIENNECFSNIGLKSSISKTSFEDIEKHNGDDRMSCGLVVYELLRLYCYTFEIGPILENLRLYQWVGVTLFTDSILLNVDRNQWYVENTIHVTELETTLREILSVVNPFKLSLDKSIINYKIAPLINKAIRAGASSEALKIIISAPYNINNLEVFKEKQQEAIDIGIQGANIFDSYITKDMGNTNVSKNYNGVIASRLCGDHHKNTIVYRVDNGVAEGSFRGRIPDIDYREFIDNYSESTSAQGHKSSFGFKIPVDQVDEVMCKLQGLEGDIDTKYLLTAGKLNTMCPGKFTIDNLDDFKKQGGIWRLGIGNSKVSTDEQIVITVSSSDVFLEDMPGQVYIYNVLGLKCKAFKPISKPIINIYIEYSHQIDCYVKE